MSLTPIRGNTNPPSLNSVAQVNPGDRVSADKGAIAPIVAVLSRQLPLPQAQQLAGQTALVRVVKSGLGGQAELEFAGQNIAVKLPQGRTLTAGEMVTVSFALGEKIDELGAGSTNGKKVADTGKVNTPLLLNTDDADEQDSSSSFVNHLSGAARLISFLEQLGKGQSTKLSAQVPNNIKQLTTQAQQEILQGQNNSLSGMLAQQVSSAVENSGLFYESHLQQWAQGKRSTDQLSQEPQAHFQPDQRIAESGIDPNAIAQSAKMVHAQLAALDNSKISLNLQGLFGQPVDVEIEPDQQEASEETDPEKSRAWSANLKLDMAHLGILQVRIRMVGSQCDVQIASSAESKQAIDPHWKDFEQAMSSHGLKLNHGQVYVTEEGGSDV